jgi:hypothetical protein
VATSWCGTSRWTSSTSSARPWAAPWSWAARHGTRCPRAFDRCRAGATSSSRGSSLPARFRPLPGRRNIVVTRQRGWRADGAEAASSLDSALALAAGAPRVCLIGGAQLFEQAMPLADELVLTEIDADFEGDVFFPPWDRNAFYEVQRESHTSASGTAFAFVTYRRKR